MSGATSGEDPAASIERHRSAIFRYVLRLVRERAEAEDLTQETFLRAHRSLGDVRDAGALEGWLYRIATNVCHDWFRGAGRRRQAQSLAFADGGDAKERPLADETALCPDQLVEQNGMSECVLRFLARLPAGRRTVLVLHDLQGYTDPEIASQLGQTVENVKVRLHRARVQLKAALSEGCDFSRDRRGVLVCGPKPRRP